MSDWDYLARQIRHRIWGDRLALAGICFATPFVLWSLLIADWGKAVGLMALTLVLYGLRQWQPPIVKDVRIDPDR